MLNTISINQTAEALQITEADALDLLLRSNIVPINGEIALDQAEEFLLCVQNTPDLGECKARANLVRVAGRYTLVFDTCALLHEKFPVLFTRLLPLLRSAGKRVIIPSKVEKELKQLFLTKPELREKIGSVSRVLDSGITAGVVEIGGDPECSFGDQQLLSLALRLRTAEEPLVVTFDRQLASDLLRMNRADSVQGHRIAVSRISAYGYLSRFNPDQPQFSPENFPGSRAG